MMDYETRYSTLESPSSFHQENWNHIFSFILLLYSLTIQLEPFFRVQHNLSTSEWAVKLSTYNMSPWSWPSVKSQVLADFCGNTTRAWEKLSASHCKVELTSWRVSSHRLYGVGIYLQYPNKELFEQSLRMGFAASNNEAEYEAFIIGSWLATSIREQHAFKHIVMCNL